MTQMLATVNTLEGAEIALAGGVDIIDLKASIDGPWHAVNLDLMHKVVAAIRRRCLISASAGDLSMQPDLLVASVRKLAASGVDLIKISMLPDQKPFYDIVRLANLASNVKFIGVFFADLFRDMSWLPALKSSGLSIAMIDTDGRPVGRLLDYIGMPGLLGVIQSCNAAGIHAGLAGLLEVPDISRLLALKPDLLGFQNALCKPAGQTSEVELASVRTIRRLIPQEQFMLHKHIVDYRPSVARAGRLSADEDLPVDLVFVDDLVLPVFIGTYTHEFNRPQNVRFAVIASVIHTSCSPSGMGDVFSYDLITDGIRMLVASGHVALVETLAERVATMVLDHPRVTKVVVKIQKLETGFGKVGIKIERKRATTCLVD